MSGKSIVGAQFIAPQAVMDETLKGKEGSAIHRPALWLDRRNLIVL
jgi:hypothetical protein